MEDCKVFLVIKKTVVLLSLFAITMTDVRADFGMAFSSGQGIESIVPYRFALSWDQGSLWGRDKSWGVHFIWENSFAFWNGPRRGDLAPGRATDLTAATTGPMFRWQPHKALLRTGILPYTEIGVGLSWLSETEIEGRMLSLHFQFEDKCGLGVRFGSQQQYDIALRAYHYSNASIKRPNSGVNLAMVSFGVWFPKEKI